MTNLSLRYLFSVILFLSLLQPTFNSLYCILSDRPLEEVNLNLFDSEKEENNEKGEKETNDAKEKEFSEDEKLRNKQSNLLLQFLNNSLKNQGTINDNLYSDIVAAVATPPPKC